MYSWNNIRTVCAVLLLIPIIHLTYLVSREMMASMDISPTAWAKEVDAYTRLDQSMQLPADPVVVIGGRRVKLWRGLEALLAPQPVLMRGLGDATVDDLTHYYSELIGCYRPYAVVLLPSISEFHLRDNKSAQQLAASIRRLVELDLSYEITRQFYVFTPIKTPLFPADNAKVNEVSAALKQWAATDERVQILDANALLASSNGSPNPDFYRIDGIHLNEHGYLRLSLLLQDRMEKYKSSM
jgi:hypothetical protein